MNGFDIKANESPEGDFIEAQDQMERGLQFKKLQCEILELPAKYQEVIALKYFEKKKISEICEILDKKEGTIKSLLSRAVDLLTEKIQN